MAERDVEKYLNEQVKKLGGLSRKWTSPNHAGVEDRIVFLPGGEVWFLEIKDTGKLPTPPQWREINKQRALGANAGYLAGKREVDEFLSAHKYMVSENPRRTWMNRHVAGKFNG